MGPSKPRLYVFAISHYCEKAKWALDWHNIGYELVHWAPGQHIAMGRKLGAETTSVPKLNDGDMLVDGSSAIIDWADANGADGSKTLTPPDCAEETRAIEARADRVIGVSARKFYYAEALNNHPERVIPILVKNVPILRAMLSRLLWPKIRKVMISRMGTTLESLPHSKDVLETEFDWLEGLLADGRPYLAGDQFTRADLSVASLLSPFFQPPECQQYAGMFIPPMLKQQLALWKDRPFAGWLYRVYRDHR
jgi:glutathione S-transferase